MYVMLEGMEQKLVSVVGMDIQAQRYSMCILNKAGKQPRYYHGRVDTASGQKKFFSLLPDDSVALLPSSPLATLALHTLGEQRITIKDAELDYAIWERAGIERGEPMARFAALVLRSVCFPPTEMTVAQQLELFAYQAKELQRIKDIGNRSQQLAGQVLERKAGMQDWDAALKLEQDSKKVLLMDEADPKDPELPLFNEQDTSFLAQLYRLLSSIH